MQNIEVVNVEETPPPRKDKKCRETILRIAKISYYLHLLIAFASALTLIILQPYLRYAITSTFVLVVVYGFMLVWLSIFNIIFVIIKRQGCAVWCNRVIAKMAIMIFPAFYIIAYVHQKFLDLFWVKAFMIYLLVISILLIIYEFYSCTWGHHEEPSYLYEPNNLDGHANQVLKVRSEFLQNRKATKK